MLLSVFSFLGLVAPAGALTVGDDAPKVIAIDQDGNEVRLADAYEKGVVLVYFYPKAGTPGCTAQACSLREEFPDFKDSGVRVIGVSGDSAAKQKQFAETNQLPFTLLADTEGVVARAFGVPMLMGIAKRESFLISNGKIVWMTESAKTGDHANEVKSALNALGLGEKK